MSFYNDIKNKTAIPLIKKFGKIAYIITEGESEEWIKSIDTITGRYVWTNIDTEEVVYVNPVDDIEELVHVVEDSSAQNSIFIKDEKGEKIEYIKYLCSECTFDPIPYDTKIKINNIIYTILKVVKLNLGDVTLLYEIYVRA